jgi:hypothetical protein
MQLRNDTAKKLKRGGVAAVVAAVMSIASPAGAGTFEFATVPGGTSGGQPVSATATFVTALNTISVTLTNLLANPISVAQGISDIFFRASNGGTALTVGSGGQTPSADYITIGAGGTVTPCTTGCSASWVLSNTGGTYHLDALVGAGGGGTGPAYLILGPGPYTNANSSIAGNAPHNPFIQESATFTLAVAGATADTVISDVVFSFGTNGETVPAIPIPAAVWLFGSGLLGLIAIARRRHGAGQSAVPAMA